MPGADADADADASADVSSSGDSPTLLGRSSRSGAPYKAVPGRRRRPVNGDYGDYKSGAGKVGDKGGAGG